MGMAGSKEDVDISRSFKIVHMMAPHNKILSVGSGFGVTEKKLDEEFGTDIITIDPLSERYNEPEDEKTAKLPMFSTVEEYLKKNEESDITLMLDWPSPNESPYALHSIYTLFPKFIILRYASCGASGSYELQAFLNSCGCPSSEVDKKTDSEGLYTMIYHDQTIIGSGKDFGGKTIDAVVLLRN